MPAYRYLIQGRVQGVGFRYFVLRRANAGGLVGHVRNLSDGSVEVVAEGPDAALAELEARIGEGPFGANVRRVERDAVGPSGEVGFHIK